MLSSVNYLKNFNILEFCANYLFCVLLSFFICIFFFFPSPLHKPAVSIQYHQPRPWHGKMLTADVFHAEKCITHPSSDDVS